MPRSCLNIFGTFSLTVALFLSINITQNKYPEESKLGKIKFWHENIKATAINTKIKLTTSLHIFLYECVTFEITHCG